MNGWELWWWLACWLSSAKSYNAGWFYLALPNGRELRVRTEHAAKLQNNAVRAESSKARRQGADHEVLGSWTGGSIWESSQVLARVLVALREELVIGKRVIELGSGCGLPGLTAGALGASETQITDSVWFVAQANIEANFGGGDEMKTKVHATKLVWGDRTDIRAVLSSSSTDEPRQFDLIIGADIVYSVGLHLELVDTIVALSKPGTIVLWATPDGPRLQWPLGHVGTAAPFFELMRERGFEVEDMSSDREVKAAVRALDPLLSMKKTILIVCLCWWAEQAPAIVLLLLVVAIVTMAVMLTTTRESPVSPIQMMITVSAAVTPAAALLSLDVVSRPIVVAVAMMTIVGILTTQLGDVGMALLVSGVENHGK